MKKVKILAIPVIMVVIIIFIFILRFTNHSFRYNFDIIFNTTKNHYSYKINEKSETQTYKLQLPPSTTFAYKHSDTGVVYYSKLNFKKFINYYENNGYIVNDNIISYNGVSFKLSEIPSEKNKYYFIDVDLINEESSN